MSVYMVVANSIHRGSNGVRGVRFRFGLGLQCGTCRVGV